MFIRPLFYYSPDGEAGGVLEGGFSTAEYFTGDEPIVEEKPATVAEVVPAEPVAEVKTETAPNDVPEVKPDIVAEAKTSKPVKPAETTEAAPIVAEAEPPSDLQLACDAFGITETDPAKQREALALARAEAVEARERQTTERQAAYEAKVDKQLGAVAAQATHGAIHAEMSNVGWELDRQLPKGVNLWDAAAWSDYENPAAQAQAYLAEYNRLRNADTTKAYFTTQFNEAKAAHDAIQAKLNETVTKYPNHDPFVANLMRDNNVTPEIFEDVVRSVDAHTKKVIATTHSANTRLTAENETLKAQITGHADAIAQAKEAGMAEGRAAALKELGDGRNLPNTTGIGTTAEKPFGVKDANALLDGWSTKDIEESMYATSNGHRR